jgi:hypothetical protein
LTSPSIFPTTATNRHFSISSSATGSYSPYFHSTHTSPAFGPQLHHVSTAPAVGFGLGSPALKPLDSAPHLRHIAECAAELSERQRQMSAAPTREQEMDQEATAALLMLNHDRRNGRHVSCEGSRPRSGKGMSVRDLLSG